MKTVTLKIVLLLLFVEVFSFGQSIDNASVGDLTSGKMLDKSQSINSETIKDDGNRDVPWFVERFRVSAGFYEMFNKSKLKIDPTNGEGSEVSFEDDLGFSKSNQTFIAEFEWRSSSRSRFDLTYYNSKRNASRHLEKTFVIGDDKYYADTDIYAYLNTEWYRFSYGYAILSKPKYEAGLLVGTHTFTTKSGIGGVGQYSNLERNRTSDFTIPLIDFGIFGGYAISDRFALRGELNYFQLKIDNVGGKVLGYNLNLLYKAWKNLEFSGGFAGLNTDVDAKTDRLNANVKWGYNGFTLMAAYTFGNKKWK